MATEYHNDYENEPIGGGNPYYRCIHCKRSDPEINGDLKKHEPWCKYRQQKESGVQYTPFENDA
jgi:hypothetical protein